LLNPYVCTCLVGLCCSSSLTPAYGGGERAGAGGLGGVFFGPVDGPDVIGGYESDHLIVRLSAGSVPANLASGRVTIRSLTAPSPAREAVVAEMLSRLNAQRLSPTFAGVAPGATQCRLDRYFTVVVPRGTDVKLLAADLLSAVAEIETAELDGIGGVLRVPPTDPLFPSQYSLLNTGQTIEGQTGTPGADIHALGAWELSTGDPHLVLAIVDTGVSQSHPDLVGRLVPGINFSGGSQSNTDDSWYQSHGTACAGVAGATTNNAIGIAGICWRASIMPVRVANIYGFGDESQCAMGLIWAADHGAKVASVSLGYPTGPIFFAAAIEYARYRDMLVVASSGNSPGQEVFFPARFPSVMAVGATDNRDQLADFTTTGPEMSVVAPGVNILTTWDTTAQPNTYVYETGTSMACPIVSGLACLIRSANAGLSADQVRLAIELSAHDLGVPGWDPQFGHGRVDALAALEFATGSAPRCLGDWNHDGVVDSRDAFQFVNDYFEGDADFDGNGVTNSLDFFGFMISYFQGC
jgi:subtilisin family serine protease